MVTISTRCSRRSRSRRCTSSTSSPRPTISPLLVRAAGAISLAARRTESERRYPDLGRTLGYRRDTVSMLWLKISGPSATTALTASRLPWKSGVRTSTVVPGARTRISRMVSAKIEAPPSGRSSRSTEVTTAWRSPMRATASPTRRGSSTSTSPPRRPLFTAQKAQARVQTSPRIMKVAVPEFQHSPRLGQRASSQTVTSLLLAHQR